MAFDREYRCKTCQEAGHTDAKWKQRNGLWYHLQKNPGHEPQVVDKKTGEILQHELGRGYHKADESPFKQTMHEVVQVRTANVAGTPEPDLVKKKTELPTVNPLAVSIFKMVPLQATIYNTPGKWVSFACAVAMGYQGTFDEFVELAMLDFWTGRDLNPFERLAPLFETAPAALKETLERKLGGEHGVPTGPKLASKSADSSEGSSES